MNPLDPLAPLDILVVDDVPLMAELLGEHYAQLGHHVRYAAEGRQALAEIETRPPDLVLCDHRMPGMSGAELLAIVRQRAREWPTLAFVFVTGLTDLREAGAVAPQGPDDYFCKPIDFNVVDSRLAETIRARRR